VPIHAAAGGIGHLAVQLAKLLGGGTVIATASSPAKLHFARSRGADVGIDYTDNDWPDQVRKAALGAWTSSSPRRVARSYDGASTYWRRSVGS
jgi:NADPH2:quinone reductase